MRLIDADALKKAVQDYANDQYDAGEYMGEYTVLSLIDNAPAVKAFTEDDKALAYCEGYVRGSHEAYTRPQGEWICKTKSTFPQYQPDEYKCPFCNVIVHRKTNYCEYCGADMRGGTENG